MELFPKLLKEELIPEVISLYRHCTNSVYIDGKRSDRYITPNNGKFLLSKYRNMSLIVANLIFNSILTLVVQPKPIYFFFI